MTVYAVFLNEPNAEVWQSIKDNWPGGRHLFLTDNMTFVAPEGFTLTKDIVEAVGIGSEHEVQGIVFEWSTHSGYNRNDLWEWLRKVQA